MSPRSLVFSSDQEMSRRLAQVFHELELHVEFCTEIFDGIKKLTSQSFDVIVADWDDGVEAGFLLKTARELKANSQAFMIVVTESDRARLAEQAGAHLLFTKPILPGYAKYALLSSQAFVARMQTWTRASQPSAQAIPESVKPSQPTPKPQIGVLETILRRSGTAPSAQRTLGSAHRTAAPVVPSFTLEESVSHPRNLHPVVEKASELQAYGGGSGRQRFGQFLWGAALGIALIAGSYVISKPGASIPTVSAAARAEVRNRPENRQLRPYNADEIKYAAPSERASLKRVSYAPDASAGISVAAVHNAGVGFLGTSAMQRQEPKTTQEAEPLLARTGGPVIPDSLKSSIDETASHDMVAKSAAASLLAAIEPVKLNEDLSADMLTTKVQPSYPESAVRAGLQGSVVLQAWIRKDGTVRDLKLIRGPWLLAQAACDAVKQWRYRPYLMNGRLVEAQTYVTINFKLP